jgi:hypothetical protein
MDGNSPRAASSRADKREAVVQVYAARCSGWQGIFGVHPWIAVKASGAPRFTVYEILGWRVRQRGTALVVRERVPDAPWFRAKPELIAEKRGDGVDELIERVKQAADAYPWARRYIMWPGPNSNTFVAWVMRAVPELEAELPPTAIGKDFIGTKLLGSAPSGRGFQISFFGLLALTLSPVEGVEFSVLGMSFGINPFRPALKLPVVGRLVLKGAGMARLQSHLHEPRRMPCPPPPPAA